MFVCLCGVWAGGALCLKEICHPGSLILAGFAEDGTRTLEGWTIICGTTELQVIVLCCFLKPEQPVQNSKKPVSSLRVQ